MYLQGTRSQQIRDPIYDASGTIAAGGMAQLLLPEAKMRAWVYIQNLSTTENLWVDCGSARATCSLTSGVVTGTTITNAGFGFTYPPIVNFVGGGNSGQGGWLGVGQIGYPAPGDNAYAPATYSDMSKQRPARGHAVLTGSAVSSIVIDDGGAGYQAAPYVWLQNDLRDPFGCATPLQNSGAGYWGTILLLPMTSTTLFASVPGVFQMGMPACTTDSFSVAATTTGHPFTCKYMP